MRLHRSLLALVLVASSTLACTDGDPATEDGRSEPAGPVTDRTGDGRGGVETVAEGLRIVDTGRPDGFDEVLVPVDAEASGALFVAHGADADDRVELLEVIDPDGVRYGPDDVLVPVQAGDLAVALPPDGSTLVAGDWIVAVRSDAGVRATAVVLDDDVGGRQVLDVVFALVGEVGLEAQESQLDVLAETYREVGETILAPHGLGVGTLTFERRPDLLDEFAELELPLSGTDVRQRELCRALSGGQGRRAVTLAVIDRIIDVDDDEGETEGNAAGLPGATIVDDSWTDCVVVQADGSRPIVQLSATVWHEVFHLVGLAHTSEASGDGFDLLDDTPECDFVEFDANFDDFVDAAECPDGDNLMFHDSDAPSITPDQAEVLRRHPLFRAAD